MCRGVRGMTTNLFDARAMLLLGSEAINLESFYWYDPLSIDSTIQTADWSSDRICPNLDAISLRISKCWSPGYREIGRSIGEGPSLPHRSDNKIKSNFKGNKSWTMASGCGTKISHRFVWGRENRIWWIGWILSDFQKFYVILVTQ